MRIGNISDYIYNSYLQIKNKDYSFAIHVIKEMGKGLLEGAKLALGVSVILLTVGSVLTFFTVASMTMAGLPISAALIMLIFKNVLIISAIGCLLLGGASGLMKGLYQGA